MRVSLRGRERSRGMCTELKGCLSLLSLTNNVETQFSPSDCCCSEDQMSWQPDKDEENSPKRGPHMNMKRIWTISRQVQSHFVHGSACVLLSVCCYRFSTFLSDTEMDQKGGRLIGKREREREWHKYIVNQSEPAAAWERNREWENCNGHRDNVWGYALILAQFPVSQFSTSCLWATAWLMGDTHTVQV